eukprot:gnl/Hemi2/1444_TR510_c0_g1_i1.p1 gnl/Hemi2/1444_TR510_c0_g1~~gnl/Hemi2/1444_TR510_c0_g1_i1.p1  ORF type:complete len:182 (-),score=41.59 gnl/Hemi2/1444_TR510_c0_g1_i1:53-598(-)
MATINSAAAINANVERISDFYQFLVGAWKRNLEWREFGGSFAHERTTNSVVVIDKVQQQSIADPSARFLRWSFGAGLAAEELSFGYIMKVFRKGSSQDSFMEWQYLGTTCHGKYMPGTGTAIFNFILPNATVVVTYRIMDPNTIAVCIVEVSQAVSPTIQYGNMFRLDSSIYCANKDHSSE